MSSSRRYRVAAFVAYLLVALWVMGPVWPAPSETLLGPPKGDPARWLIRTDQTMVLWTVTRNARVILTEPWNLRGDAQCYPLHHAYALGEHMFGEGMLAALPLLATGDPIHAYNLMLVLALWIPAMAMYALSFHFTRSPAAAFVAGLLFLLTRPRLLDPTHPFVHGDLWAPLVLLFVHRLLTRGGWGNAFALGLALILQLTESFYAILACTIVTGVYATVVALRRSRDLPSRLGPSLLALGMAGAAAYWILGPYLELGEVWGGLERPHASFAWAPAFAPGGRRFIGMVMSALVVVALIDRVRRRRTTDDIDPRWPLFAGGLLVAWCSIGAIQLPWLGWVWPSPLVLLRGIVPGLSSVRVLSAVGIGATLPAAALAGYGVAVLTERLRTRGTIAVTAFLCAAILAEHFVPGWATRSFGRPVDLEAYALRPDEQKIEVVRSAVQGPVIDLPYESTNHFFQALPLGAFHDGPLALCANSFSSPIESQVATLAKSLPSKHAVESLGALGFETVLVHGPRRHRLFQRRALAVPGITLAAASEGVAAFRLSSPSETRSDGLSPGPISEPPIALDGSSGRVPFTFENSSDITHLHPAPLEPTDLTVRWTHGDGSVAAESNLRGLLPLVVAARSQASIDFEIPVPVPKGVYRIELVRPEEPSHILAQQSVAVTSTSP